MSAVKRRKQFETVQKSAKTRDKRAQQIFIERVLNRIFHGLGVVEFLRCFGFQQQEENGAEKVSYQIER